DLLNDIVQTLIALGPDAVPADVDILGCLGASSARHGRERATLEHYNVGDLVHEYALFRHVVTDFFNEDLPGDTLAADVITRVIEYSSLTSVNEFVRAIQEVQQKLIATLVHDVRTPLGV